MAYSLYKRDKLKFCEAWQQSTGSAPTDAEIQTFIYTANLHARVESYRNQSEQLLGAFSEHILGDQLEELEDEFEKKLITELRSSRPFWQDVGVNVVANLVALAALALLVFVVQVKDEGFFPALQRMFDPPPVTHPVQGPPAATAASPASS